MENVLTIISIVVTIISIFLGVFEQQSHVSLFLIVFNVVLLIVMAVIYRPYIFQNRLYRTLINRKQYYSLIYVNYVNTNNKNRKNRIYKLNVKFSLCKEGEDMLDLREYSFSSKKIFNCLF